MAEILVKKDKSKFFRGKNTEELRAMDTREFAKLVKSRARRTILRNYDVIEAFVRKVHRSSGVVSDSPIYPHPLNHSIERNWVSHDHNPNLSQH